MCVLNFKQNYCSGEMDRERNLPWQRTAREDQISNILSSSVACAQGSDDNDGVLKKQLLNMQVLS